VLGYESWWDVAVAEVSQMESVEGARAECESGALRCDIRMSQVGASPLAAARPVACCKSRHPAGAQWHR
jgi:hypothetical protein